MMLADATVVKAPRGLITKQQTDAASGWPKLQLVRTRLEQIVTESQPAPADVFGSGAGLIHPRSAKPLIVDVLLDNAAGARFVFEALELHLVQPGGDTAVWSNRQQAGLVEVTLTLNRRDRLFNIRFKPKREPENAHEFLLVLQSQQCLAQPFTLLIQDRSLGVELLHTASAKPVADVVDEQALALVRDLDAIQRKLRRPILITPGKQLTAEEALTITKLRTVLHDGGFTSTWSEFTLHVLPPGIPSLLATFGHGQASELRIEREESEELFGIDLPLGRALYEGQVTLRNEQAVRDALAQVSDDQQPISVDLAPAGDGMMSVQYLNWQSPAPDMHFEREPAGESMLTPELEEALFTTWPTLSIEQRALWSEILTALLPQDEMGLLDTLEILEDSGALARIQHSIHEAAEGQVYDWEDVAQELGL